MKWKDAEGNDRTASAGFTPMTGFQSWAKQARKDGSVTAMT